jgi:L-ascorbate metabolism protein UlaG (beta-lactamase superfamily)
MVKIVWLRHASVLLEGSKRIYIDPWELKQSEPADLVLITHDHYDHLSAADLKKVCTAQTVVVAPEAALADLRGVPGQHQGVLPGQRLQAAGLELQTLASYNHKKKFHPQAAGNVGYLVELDGERIYHAGDTDRIPEMKDLRPDVALLPCGGTYTMDAAEAAAAAEDLGARKVIPIHWGAIIGDRGDAEKLKKLCKVPVEIQEPAAG